ncbi:MAG: methionine--tRNA ligase [Candidatus Yanofskybacteria bacterium]|nr:methionine--tRNA ligase [Candidatus Yanofskybacteria bacterium]
MARFYITTSIMYANARPHVGFALEMIQADAVARYRRLMGDEVVFCTGTDEHGTKVMRTAEQAGTPTQEFVDRVAAEVGTLARRLNTSNTDFIRTSDRVRHWPAAERIWRELVARGDLYKRSYEGYYCVGHEAFIKESELENGLCPLHKSTPERLQEENWFFRLSKYRDDIRKLIESGRLAIVPETRTKELLNLLDDAEDVSFSRPAQQLPWGIPVPDDPTQTMYVWADALTNYISVLGYGTDEARMAFWPASVHLIGKDILRFHAMVWPAMLISAGLEVPRAIFVHGFITVDGQKMSKTLGNVIDPLELLDQQPADVVRYFMLREIPSTEDGDFSWKSLESRYVSDLANGLGNLVQRIATLIETKLGGTLTIGSFDQETEKILEDLRDTKGYHAAFADFRLHEALAHVWTRIGIANQYINDREPWKQEGEAQALTLRAVAAMVLHIAWLLQPFMPETAEKIGATFGVALTETIRSDARVSITKGSPLFPRPEKK